MLVSFRGRKSGKAYQQPVSYVPDGDTLLTPGGGKWKVNLLEGQPALESADLGMLQAPRLPHVVPFGGAG